MPKSLADLRADKPRSRPERAHTICLAQNLVAEVGSLSEELVALETRPRGDDDEPTGPPKRLGEGEDPRIGEIKARMGELLAEMADYEGELRLRARDDGDWRRWCNQHPARDEDKPGHKRDLEVSFGYCDADALIDSLGAYAHSWNGEVLEEGDWDILAASISLADKKALARLVVSMHESDISIPKWRSALSASLANERASTSPVHSGSPTGGSTDGNPPSDTNTSTPTGT